MDALKSLLEKSAVDTIAINPIMPSSAKNVLNCSRKPGFVSCESAIAIFEGPKATISTQNERVGNES
jgi:hypothetical protein